MHRAATVRRPPASVHGTCLTGPWAGYSETIRPRCSPSSATTYPPTGQVTPVPLPNLWTGPDWLHHETLPAWLESLIAERAAAGPDPMIAWLACTLALEKIAASEVNFRGDGVVYRQRWAATGDDSG